MKVYSQIAGKYLEIPDEKPKAQSYDEMKRAVMQKLYEQSKVFVADIKPGAIHRSELRPGIAGGDGCVLEDRETDSAGLSTGERGRDEFR